MAGDSGNQITSLLAWRLSIAFMSQTVINPTEPQNRTQNPTPHMMNRGRLVPKASPHAGRRSSGAGGEVVWTLADDGEGVGRACALQLRPLRSKPPLKATTRGNRII